jgi:hypothetical protein
MPRNNLLTISLVSILTLVFPLSAFATSSISLTSVTQISGANTGIASPDGLTVDSNGNIFVANSNWVGNGVASVTVYAPNSTGNVTPSRTISVNLTGLVNPAGIAVSSTQIFVGQVNGDILVFPLNADGNIAPTHSISTGYATMAFAYDDTNGYLAVGSWNKISVYTSPQNGSTAKYELTHSSLNQSAFIRGVAWDETGGLFASVSAPGGSVLYFAPGATGVDAPLRSIEGNATQLVEPGGLSIQPETNLIFVSGSSSQKLLVFDISATGNIAPVREYSDPNFTSFSRIAFQTCNLLVNVSYAYESLSTYEIDGCPAAPPPQPSSNALPTSELAQTGFGSIFYGGTVAVSSLIAGISLLRLRKN